MKCGAGRSLGVCQSSKWHVNHIAAEIGDGQKLKYIGRVAWRMPRVVMCDIGVTVTGALARARASITARMADRPAVVKSAAASALRI